MKRLYVSWAEHRIAVWRCRMWLLVAVGLWADRLEWGWVAPALAPVVVGCAAVATVALVRWYRTPEPTTMLGPFDTRAEAIAAARRKIDEDLGREGR